MSIHTIERALFELTAAPQRLPEYQQDPRRFLAAYPLTAEELELVLALDVKELCRRGLNPMLAMRAFNLIAGRDKFPEYLQRLNGG